MRQWQLLDGIWGQRDRRVCRMQRWDILDGAGHERVVGMRRVRRGDVLDCDWSQHGRDVCGVWKRVLFDGDRGGIKRTVCVLPSRDILVRPSH